jgi:hypothetical protein
MEDGGWRMEVGSSESGEWRARDGEETVDGSSNSSFSSALELKLEPELQ